MLKPEHLYGLVAEPRAPDLEQLLLQIIDLLLEVCGVSRVIILTIGIDV